MTSDWNVVSNQRIFIDQAVDQSKIVLYASLKAKKHCAFYEVSP